MKWLIFTYILFLIDNRTKREAEARLKVGAKPVPIAGGRVLLRRVSNKGMAGGFLPEKSEKVRMASTAAGAIIALSFLCEIPRKRRFFSKAGLALLTAGAAGNLYDRWNRGSVTDFLSIGNGEGKPTKAVFNLADVMILAGGMLLIPTKLFDGGIKR